VTLHPVVRVVFDPEARTERLPLYADGPLEVTGRRSARVPAGESVSFASYFNAFPAGQWRSSTTVREVVLAIELAGEGLLTVHRSNGSGRAVEFARRQVAGAHAEEFRLDLDANADGGWIWFDLAADGAALELREATWWVEGEPRESRLATLSMTTMDKPEFALGVLRRIAGEPVALAALDEVLVVDQGSRKVAEHSDFAAVSSALDGRLRVIDQPNLGGSGGFARGMLEVLDAGRSGSVVLLDDDVELEPESLARAVAFAAFTSAPTIVGGHFFDLQRPRELHAFSEAVSVDDFDWGPVGPGRHDFGREPLRAASRLHAPARADYNGWWFCLLPVDVLRAVGLSLPAFLKWDDAEYGLRAAAAGFPTVSLPGMAIWHVSWLDKNDALGWQSFFHARNRLVAALVDARAPGRRLPWRNLELDVRYLLTADYHVVELRHLAYESVWAGPETLHGELATRLPAVRETMREFPSGVTAPAPEELPAGALPAAKGRWWRVMWYRDVSVVSSDGEVLQRHVRDVPTLRRMLRRAFADYRRMRREWRSLGSAYRAALPELTSPETWRRTLGL